MTDTQAKVIQRLLIQLGLGVTPGVGPPPWSVYYHNVTDKGDNAIFVFGEGGVLGGRDMDSGQREEHFGVMIQVRSLDPEEGSVKAEAIRQALLTQVKRLSVVVGDKTYRVWSYTATSGVIPLGQEEKGRRSEFSFNGTATIEEL